MSVNAMAAMIDYDMHPNVSAKDGVTLYIRHGNIKAMVEHSDGTNSNVSFFGGQWRSDFRMGNKAQRHVLDKLAYALGTPTVDVCATLHHVRIRGIGRLPFSTRRMVARRLGMDTAAMSTIPIVSNDEQNGRIDLDLVAMSGASIRAVIDGTERRA